VYGVCFWDNKGEGFIAETLRKAKIQLLYFINLKKFH
jgi:hypothetical protein